MSEKTETYIALFVRDEKTGRRAVNATALRALGIDPVEARDRGYSIKQAEESLPNLAA